MTEVRGAVTLPLVLAGAVALPGLASRIGILHLPLFLETLTFGVAILGAAFLVTWASEVAQHDISQALAIATLALIAVLPEYAVDLYLAWCAGRGDAECAHLAVANMTGANRLLIGIGWALVVFVFWGKTGEREVELRPEQRIDVGYLLFATLWAFTIPLRSHLSVVDLVVLGGMFVFYVLHVARQEVEEPELIGTSQAISSLPQTARRVATVGLFLVGAAVILGSAEPFAEGLREIGRRYGISQFLLIQWLAPLASESPEMAIAVILTLRMKARDGLGALISSKVNQWTLLVGTLWLVFAVAGSAGGAFFTPLGFDARQSEEVFLTAAQSLFAVAVISNLSISRIEAVALFVLFGGQLVFPGQAVRLGFAFAYLVLFLAILASRREVRSGLRRALREVFRRATISAEVGSGAGPDG